MSKMKKKIHNNEKINRKYIIKQKILIKIIKQEILLVLETLVGFLPTSVVRSGCEYNHGNCSVLSMMIRAV